MWADLQEALQPDDIINSFKVLCGYFVGSIYIWVIFTYFTKDVYATLPHPVRLSRSLCDRRSCSPLKQNSGHKSSSQSGLKRGRFLPVLSRGLRCRRDHRAVSTKALVVRGIYTGYLLQYGRNPTAFKQVTFLYT